MLLKLIVEIPKMVVGEREENLRMVAHVEFMNRKGVLFLGVDEPKCCRIAKKRGL